MTTTSSYSRFSYQARDQRGQIVNGYVSANSLNDATRRLRAEGKYIVDIKPAKSGGAEGVHVAGGGESTTNIATKNVKARREEVIYFTIQLSVMVDTGMPLSDALISLSEQTFSDSFLGVLQQIVQDVTSGKDFSRALETFPRTFPKYYVSLVRASELSGTMGPMLRKLADYLMSQRETTKKVKGALIYPSFLFVVSIAVTIFLLTGILPKFTAIFAGRQVALPLPTQLLMSISDSLIVHWHLWIIASIASFISASLFIGTKSGQRTLDYLQLNIPIFNTMFHKLFLSRSLSTMGTMISSGVPVLDSLEIVKEVAGNIYYQELWEDVRNRVQNGSQLSDPLLRSTLVPKSVAQMIHSGEKSGELSNVLARLSAFMEEDLKTAIKTATQFIEPVMIGMMGLMIGGVAVAMLMPILTISKVMAQ